MIVEIIVHDGDYPNGNSWKYGFSSVEEAINFLKNDKEHLQTLGGLTPLAPDSLKAGDLSLPESVKVENALPAESG